MLYVVLAVVVVLAIALWLLLKKRQAAPAAQAPPPDEAAAYGIDPTAYGIDPTADEDRLNPRPRARMQTPDQCWMPPGRAAEVHGYTIGRGMVYVGAGLYKDRAAWKPEDCLIDPTLDVNPDNPDTAGRTVPLWPAYGKLNPSARAAYLAFLAAGADDEDAHPGYVLLYLSGLERRLLKDRLPTGEGAILLEEVRRLHARYGRHPLLDEAANRVLAAAAERSYR